MHRLCAVRADVPQPVTGLRHTRIVLFQMLLVRPNRRGNNDSVGAYLVITSRHPRNSAGINQESVNAFTQGDLDAFSAAALRFEYADDARADVSGTWSRGASSPEKNSLP